MRSSNTAEFAAARRLAAVLLLLGVGTLTSALPQDANRPEREPFDAPLQDPVREPVKTSDSASRELYDLQQREQLWPLVDGVTIERIRPGDFLEMISLPNATTSLSDPQVIVAFAERFGAVIRDKRFPFGGSSFPLKSATIRVVLHLQDGRAVVAIASTSEKPELQFSAWDGFRIEDAEFVEQLRGLAALALGNPKIVHGWALSEADLDALPGTIETLTCLTRSAPDLATLQRFESLRAVTFLQAYQRGYAATAELALETFARLPALRHLGIRTHGLTDRGLALLESMPNLESLQLHVAFGGFTLDKLEKLGPRLTSLRVLGVRLTLADLRRVATWPKLRELWFAPNTPDELSRLDEVIASMPALRRLAVTGAFRNKDAKAWDASALLRRLPGTQIEKLQLRSIAAPPESWLALGDATRLRELDVRALDSLDAPLVDALAGLGQLRRLDVRSNSLDEPTIARLRAALPDCELFADLASPNAFATSSDAGYPSWSAGR